MTAVSVVVIDAAVFQKKTKLLCSAIRKFQNYGLHVIVMSHKDIRSEIEETMDIGHFLCFKAYNHGFIDTIATAIEYEAFYVTRVDFADLQEDWRFPRKVKEFLKANPELHVPFYCDHTGFHPKFADGVIPGDFRIADEEDDDEDETENETEEAPKPKSGPQSLQVPQGPQASWPSAWNHDCQGPPEMAAMAVDCDAAGGSVRRVVLAILGTIATKEGTEEYPLLQTAKSLCSGFKIDEVGWMKDWKYPVRAPWKEAQGGGNLPHIVFAKSSDPDDVPFWAIGVSSRKRTRERAARLAFYIAQKATSAVPSLSGPGGDSRELQRLVERATLLINRAKCQPEDLEDGVEEVFPVSSPEKEASEAECVSTQEPKNAAAWLEIYWPRHPQKTLRPLDANSKAGRRKNKLPGMLQHVVEWKFLWNCQAYGVRIFQNDQKRSKQFQYVPMILQYLILPVPSCADGKLFLTCQGNEVDIMVAVMSMPKAKDCLKSIAPPHVMQNLVQVFDVIFRGETMGNHQPICGCWIQFGVFFPKDAEEARKLVDQASSGAANSFHLQSLDQTWCKEIALSICCPFVLDAKSVASCSSEVDSSCSSCMLWHPGRDLAWEVEAPRQRRRHAGLMGRVVDKDWDDNRTGTGQYGDLYNSSI